MLRFDAPKTFLLQQPEVHLHPSAQAAQSLFCQVTGAGRQLVVETHSDHLMDRVRMDVRDDVSGLRPEDVSILFFERGDLTSTSIRSGSTMRATSLAHRTATAVSSWKRRRVLCGGDSVRRRLRCAQTKRRPRGVRLQPAPAGRGFWNWINRLRRTGGWRQAASGAHETGLVNGSGSRASEKRRAGCQGSDCRQQRWQMNDPHAALGQRRLAVLQRQGPAQGLRYEPAIDNPAGRRSRTEQEFHFRQAGSSEEGPGRATHVREGESTSGRLQRLSQCAVGG